MKLSYERLLKQEFKDDETIEVDAKALQEFAKKKERLEKEAQSAKAELRAIAEAYERLTAKLTVEMIKNASIGTQMQYLKDRLEDTKRTMRAADYKLDLSA